MKTPSSLLHQLIRNMSAAEKKHFSKYLLSQSSSTGVQDSIYNGLFTAIGKMKTYNEELLKRKFRGRINTERSFITLKSGLKELVLESLRSFGVAQSEEAGYRKKLDIVEILAAKGLEKEALVVVRQLKKEIKKKTRSGGTSDMTDVLIMESWLIERADSTNVSAMQELMLENMKNSHEMYLSHHLLYNVNRLALMVTDHLPLRGNGEAERFAAIKQEMEMWKHTDADREPFDRFLYLVDAGANMALLDADFERYWQYADKMWQRFSAPEEVKQFIQRKSLVFFAGAFINAARSCVLTQKQDELGKMLSKAQPIYEQHLAGDPFHYPYYLYFQLMLAYLQQDHKAIIVHLKPLQQLELWDNAHANILQQRTFASGMALAHYRIGDRVNAEKWARRTSGLHAHRVGETVAVEFCQLFQFMVEFERLRSENTSVNEWLKFALRAEAQLDILKKQKGMDFRFSMVVLRFIIHASQSMGLKDQALQIENLRSEFLELKDVPNVKQFYALFDFDAWVTQLGSVKT